VREDMLFFSCWQKARKGNCVWDDVSVFQLQRGKRKMVMAIFLWREAVLALLRSNQFLKKRTWSDLMALVVRRAEGDIFVDSFR
jgi:hypothetical protein